MKKHISCLFMTVSICVTAQTTVNVFDNSGEVPYRIPAIASTPSGTLVAVADYRYSKQDIGNGRVDLHVRTSADNGSTWSEIIMPEEMEGGGEGMKVGYGDPCIVADRETGRLLVISCAGTPGFFDGSREQHQGMARFYSDDEGKTWTEPEYIDEEAVYAPFDSSAYGAVKGWFVASGKIHQSRDIKKGSAYRLFCAGSTLKDDNNRTTANWVLYSDDFGKTWQFLGGCDVSPIPGGDEPKVDELPNGDIVISSRHNKGRQFNIFHFTDRLEAKGEWGKKALSALSNYGTYSGGTSNGCNGEIQILPTVRTADGVKTWIALQSLPVAGSRKDVSIYYKDLEDPVTYSTPAKFAREWTLGLKVSENTSAYSTWTLCKDHSIGFLFEENAGNSGYDINYCNLTIEEITNGLYTYDPDSGIAPIKTDKLVSGKAYDLQGRLVRTNTNSRMIAIVNNRKVLR